MRFLHSIYAVLLVSSLIMFNHGAFLYTLKDLLHRSADAGVLREKNCFATNKVLFDGRYDCNAERMVRNLPQNFSLRFYGYGYDQVDRVKIQIDNPEIPADIGNHDFTIEFWMKAFLLENNSGTCTSGGDSWTSGNIIIDRDIFGAGDYGDFGVSLYGGKISFGTANSSTSQSICSATTVADGNWHHIALTRRVSDGRIQIFIDGQLDASSIGPTGNLSYRNGRVTSYTNDAYLVFGAEKHDYDPSNYPSYSGFLDEVHLSTTIRYSDNFSIPTTPFAPDENTAALYRFNEGPVGSCTGSIIDSSSTGLSVGNCHFGGQLVAGPVYTTDTPFPSPTVRSITRASPNPTSAVSVDFTVAFSKDVAGVDANDFSLFVTGITGASITGVSGSGDTYTVNVSTGTGSGTIRLDVSDLAIIEDLDENTLAGLPFTGGEVYTVIMSIAFGKTSPSNGATDTSLSPSLSWQTSTGAVSYEYCIDTSNNDTCNTNWISVDDETSASVSGLAGNTTYYWQVRAVNAVGDTEANSGEWWSFTTVVPPLALSDYDGDGKSDPAKFYPSSGVLWWQASSTSSWESTWLGNDTYDLVSGSDYDGDGKTDPAKFVSSIGTLWYIQSSDSAWRGEFLGVDEYEFVGRSDFDGDDKSDPAKFVSSIGALWYIESSTGLWQGVYLGPDSFEYLAGNDFDGDGITDPAKYVPSVGVLWYYRSTDSTWQGVYLGVGDYEYISGNDYDGDGKSDPTVFYASTGTVWWQNSSTGVWDGVWMGPGAFTFVGGHDFDGDGKTDLAKFDAATGQLSWLSSDDASWYMFDLGTDGYELAN